MTNRIVEAAALLEERMRASPLHKLSANYVIGAGNCDPTVANFFFRDRPDMEKARLLETAYAAGLITNKQFCDEFPNVLFITVNAHYLVPELPVIETFVSTKVYSITLDVKGSLTELTIELCKGAKLAYVPDDRKLKSDIVVGVTVARSGTVSDVYKTDYKPPFSFRSGTSITDVFDRMERYVMTNRHSF